MRRRARTAAEGEAGANPWRRIVEIVGAERAELIIAELGGQRFSVPSLDRDNLHKCIRAELDCDCDDERHHSYRAVARRLGVHLSLVFRVGNATD